MRHHHSSQMTTPIKFKTVTNCENECENRPNPQPSTASSATVTNATSQVSLTEPKKNDAENNSSIFQAR